MALPDDIQSGASWFDADLDDRLWKLRRRRARGRHERLKPVHAHLAANSELTD